jgi:hypothetical protein
MFYHHNNSNIQLIHNFLRFSLLILELFLFLELYYKEKIIILLVETALKIFIILLLSSSDLPKNILCLKYICFMISKNYCCLIVKLST